MNKNKSTLVLKENYCYSYGPYFVMHDNTPIAEWIHGKTGGEYIVMVDNEIKKYKLVLPTCRG
jgi:hypothetical protein